MKTINKLKQSLLLALVAVLSGGASVNAQCYENIGTSPNAYTSASSRTNQLVVNNDLNTVVFIHRNDISVFGGDNGVYRYDISNDNGVSWLKNQGYLNPSSNIATQGGRYPQVGIYNPAGNTNVSNASLVYYGATVANGIWNGHVSGVQSLNGVTAPTENYNQAGAVGTEIPGGLCQSIPGTFWTIDVINSPGQGYTGIRILKGVYSSGNINWSVKKEETLDFNTDYFGYSRVGDWDIAFDPSGQYGWAILTSHLRPSTDFNIHPIVFYTSDGGNTWSNSQQIEITALTGVINIQPAPSMNGSIDISVDANGKPHILMGIFESYYSYPYSVNYDIPANLFDLTLNGSTWVANHITQFNFSGYYTADAGQFAFRPQISRSDDGTILVYTWSESDQPSFDYFNHKPNVKSIAYDITTGQSSCVMTYSLVCPSDMDGKMYQTTVSPNLLEENGLYTVPLVLTIYNISGSGDDPATHTYLNGLSFNKGVLNASPPPVPGITVNGSTTVCSGTMTELIADLSSSYLWSTGETTQTISVASGDYWVVNPDNNYCVAENNRIRIEWTLSPYIYAYNNYLCNGESTEITTGYIEPGSVVLWNTGETTESIFVDAAGTYNVTISGCQSNDIEIFTSVNTYRLGITASGPTTLCFGEMITLTADASDNYLWTTGETTQSIDVYAYYSELYAVVNPDSNFCIDASNSVFIDVIYPPEIYFSSNIICDGTPVELSVYYYSTGNNIEWSTGETAEIIAVSTPGVYNVTVDGCEAWGLVELFGGSTPANDNLCNAQSLVIGAETAFDNTCATAEPGETVPPLVDYSDTGSQVGWLDEYGDGPVVENSVWFSFIAPNSKAVNITSSFDEWPFDTQLALYSSSDNTCSGMFTLIAASDDVDTDNGDYSSFINRAYCLQPGKKYYIQIDGWGGMFGAGTVQVAAVPNRLTVCHRTASGSTYPLIVSGCALNGHLGHGDVIGDCPGVRTIATVEDDAMALTFVTHPNPTSGELNVSFTSEDDEKYSLTIVDVTGRTVISENKDATTGLNSSVVDMSNVMPGVYILVVRKGENMLQTKIIKE